MIIIISGGGINDLLDYGVNITSMKPNLSVFCCFYFDEWSIQNFGHSSSDLCLPYSCRSNHQNILWSDIVPELNIS